MCLGMITLHLDCNIKYNLMTKTVKESAKPLKPRHIFSKQIPMGSIYKSMILKHITRQKKPVKRNQITSKYVHTDVIPSSRLYPLLRNLVQSEVLIESVSDAGETSYVLNNTKVDRVQSEIAETELSLQNCITVMEAMIRVAEQHFLPGDRADIPFNQETFIKYWILRHPYRKRDKAFSIDDVKNQIEILFPGYSVSNALLYPLVDKLADQNLLNPYYQTKELVIDRRSQSKSDKLSQQRFLYKTYTLMPEGNTTRRSYGRTYLEKMRDYYSFLKELYNHF